LFFKTDHICVSEIHSGVFQVDIVRKKPTVRHFLLCLSQVWHIDYGSACYSETHCDTTTKSAMGGKSGHNSGAQQRRRNNEPRHGRRVDKDHPNLQELKEQLNDTLAIWKRRASFVVGVASILYAYLWYPPYENAAAHRQVDEFWKKLCSSEVYCDPGLMATQGRLVKTSRNLPRGTTILQVPKQLTFWDLDALRNEEFVQRELFFDKNSLTTMKKRSGATYLAAYLAKLWKEVSDQATNSTTIEDDEKQNRNTPRSASLLFSTVSMPPMFKHWFQVLPTYEDFRQFHPVLWTDEELARRLGKETTAYQYVILWKEMYYDDYYDLANASATFQNEISLERYLQARLIVTTRSLKVSHDELKKRASKPTLDELNRYELEAGVQLLRHGYHALVPGFDFFNHHALQYGASYDWDDKSQSFQTKIRATPSLAAGSEILINYGQHHSDPDLFARYGFVTGDGTHFTEVNLAVHHQVMFVNRQEDHKLRSRSFITKLAKYLQYDDGYDHCVEKPTNEGVSAHKEEDASVVAWDLKKSKIIYLHERSNSKTWFITLEPRVSPDQGNYRPEQLESTGVPQFDLNYHGGLLMGTSQALSEMEVTALCRAISVIHTDYGGQALEILLENASNRTFFLAPDPVGNQALEYRTWNCVRRLATQALQRYEDSRSMSLAKQLERTASLTRANTSWAGEHLRAGEMLSLEMLITLTTSHLKEATKDFVQSESLHPAFHVRDNPCGSTGLTGALLPSEEVLNTLVTEVMGGASA
jgi:hypothetical protein